MTINSIDCLLLHGWGMNSQVWHDTQQHLPDWINVKAYDLPGHGSRNKETMSDLPSLADDVMGMCQLVKSEKPLVLVAWSLSALPVMYMLGKRLGMVDGLMFVSTNPCFVNRSDWDEGIDASVFDQFADSLEKDFSGTIRRFLSLQVKGSESGRATLRKLRERILQQPQPNAKSLEQGLELLKHVDLRHLLANIEIPVAWALGGQDGLVKASFANQLSQLMPGSQVQVYEKAGHAPFLSHSDEFVEQLSIFAGSLLKR